MKMPVEISVNLHAWRNDEGGNCNYCDPAEETPHGWCVYTRTDFDNEGAAPPFDTSDEQDFSTYEEAKKHGEERAARLGVPLQEY